MADYAEGDIVLLSRSKLGIMLSPRTVREIRGEETEMSRIVKKLSAKELAETLVDLMERYNNLETKSLFKPNTTCTHHNITTNTHTKNTKSSTNLTMATHNTHTTTTTTSSSEPKPNDNILEIPKTPNYGNHAISPTDSMQKNAKFNKHIFYHYNTTKNTKNTSDTHSTKSNDESLATTTTTTSTISSLSPNVRTSMNNMESKVNINVNTPLQVPPQTSRKSIAKKGKNKLKSNSKLKKNKLFKMSKKKTSTVRVMEGGQNKSKSSRFLWKNKKKISKRSSSNDSPYKHNNNYGYIQYAYNNNHVLPRETAYNNNNAPKTRFSRSRSNGDTHPYNPHYRQQHGYEHTQSPFITYTPSQHTNNSTITPPIPSPNMQSHYNVGYHPQYTLHNDTTSPATYSSTTPIPTTQNMRGHNAPPYHAYNKYNLHTHTHAHSSPNPQPNTINPNELIDVLLSAPKKQKKQKSHPMSYKKRTISYGNNNKIMMECSNLMTPSDSDSVHRDIPTYPQAYVPTNNPLNLLKSPKTPLNTIDPILAYRDHIKNNSNTHTHTLESENYNYIHENSYTNSSLMNMNYKINKQYNDSYIYDSYNGISQISPRNSRTVHTHTTHQRGASHSPHNSYHRNARKNYHSPRGTNTFGRRPFSANHQKLNYFDFPTPVTKNNAYKNHDTKSVTFTEIEGKQFAPKKNKNTSKITRIYPSNNTKPKLSQNNAYSTPVYNDYVSQGKRVYNGNNVHKNHWKQAKTMTKHLDKLDRHDLDDNAWYLTSNWKDNYDNNNHERSQTDTTIVHSNKCKEYHEGRKSHSFSHLGVTTVTSMDDMMTPLTLSPAPHRHIHGGGHKKQKRSQSVVEFFDPIQVSNLADLHRQSSDEAEAEVIDDGDERDKNYKIVLNKTPFYIQDNFNNNNKLIKPRFSRSTTSIQTAQSSQTTNSFTPTISHTPSYLREENLWQKSMTHKLSQTGSSQTQITSDDDEEWMLHNHININGNTNSDSIHRFFGNDDVEVEEFPNIESPSNKSNDTVKIHKNNINEKVKPVVPPKLSHHDIVNEHQLQKQLNRKYRQENMSPTSSKSSLNNY